MRACAKASLDHRLGHCFRAKCVPLLQHDVQAGLRCGNTACHLWNVLVGALIAVVSRHMRALQGLHLPLGRFHGRDHSPGRKFTVLVSVLSLPLLHRRVGACCLAVSTGRHVTMDRGLGSRKHAENQRRTTIRVLGTYLNPKAVGVGRCCYMWASPGARCMEL